ncbi:hypothetical protein [Bacillus smithii]|uniref:hypothetical protein n=1 Tax=Bacillus smithii TaxID=1479 RepID=UPI003D1C81BA
MEKYRDITIEVKVEEGILNVKPLTKRTILFEEKNVSNEILKHMIMSVAKELGITPKDIYDFINEKREETKKKEELLKGSDE